MDQPKFIPLEVIVADYVLTDSFRRDIAHLFSSPVSPEAIATLTSANPRYIEAALDEIQAAHGSTQAWLASLGVDETGHARLVALLTE